jgi:glucose/arabinose dehydrogenase
MTTRRGVLLLGLSCSLVACSQDSDDANGGAAGGSAAAGGEPATGGGGAGQGGGNASGGRGASGTGGSGGGQARVSTCAGPESARISEAALPPGYCAFEWARAVDDVRGITVDASGDVLVIERGSSSVVVLWDDDGDGVSGDDERRTIATAQGLNHGIAIDGGALYASSAQQVYRWPYVGGRQELGAPETVISGIPSGGHSTRTLAFDAAGNLYVSIGSGGNVDPDSSRARVVRFTAAQVEAGAELADAEVFADGMRNEVGIRFDAQGRLWGVENERDDLMRDDLGGDIHNDNPAEELNLMAEAGRFYGYPYCWSEFLLPSGTGSGPGTQWADPATIDDGVHDDAWCQDPDNVVPPVVTMQAHSAPLDLLFYPGGSFPDDVAGDALVSFHGSWNRSPATGYKVVRIPFGPSGMPDGEIEALFEQSGDGPWPYRPVGLAAGPSGELYVTSDSSSSIVLIGHDGS